MIAAFLRRIFFVALSVGLVAVGGFFWIYYEITGTGPLAQPATVIFPKGTGAREMAAQLEEAGVIRYAPPLLLEAVRQGRIHRFKAGEYEFPAGISVREIIEMLSAGRVVVHKITVPEGLAVQDVLALLEKEPLLTGEVTKEAAAPEGMLMPDTYHFERGEARASVLSRMRAAQEKALAALWEKRAENLPFSTPQEALTLASIVEKETGLREERGRVAAVFVNRLRLGMRLQADPTVAYGIVQEQGAPLGRALTIADLERPTPYNTYTIPGLPVGPICNPGRASIEAVLNPPATEELYFVALGDGSGGHRFARTLEEHNANVAAYRQALREKSGAER